MTDVPAALTGHVIVTGANGVLESPTPEQVQTMVEAMVDHGCGVVHFHGGLVSHEKGLGIAAELLPVYTGAGAYPVFFVWGSDVMSVLKGNLTDIAKEEIFQRLLKKVLSFAAGKVKEELGFGRGVGGLTPVPPLEVSKQLKRLDSDDEPFSQHPVAADVPDLTATERTQFENVIKADGALLAHLEEAVKGADPDAEPVRAKGITVRVEVAKGSLLDPAAVAELQEQEGVVVARGIGFSTAMLLKKAVKVLVAVIQRRRHGRWHGLYATVVEELLREFYLANAGGALWATMKGDTLDTFKPDDDHPRGGDVFLRALAGALPSTSGPAISLVGHSTGAVFIDNLLLTLAAGRRVAIGGVPKDFRFSNVIFLAPANTFTDFAPVADRHDEYWTRFRLFAMNDDAERADRVFSFIYPHSLLYLVSGLLERDAQGKSEGGKPLVGLHRWCTGTEAEPGELPAVRRLFAGDAECVAWSPGALTSAIRHGDFDNDALVKENLRRLIADGCA